MNLKVPYLPDAAIEASVSALLAAYARREGSQIRPPAPVESILQDHLRLHLGFDDLRTKLRVPDVLGALATMTPVQWDAFIEVVVTGYVDRLGEISDYLAAASARMKTKVTAADIPY